MTRARLIARCAAELGLKTTGEELTLMQEWANEGVVDVLLETKCHMDIGTANLTAGEGSYTLDTDILLADESTFTLPVRLISVAELTSLPTMANDVIRYVAFDGDMMLVYPLPASDDTVSWLFVPRPAPMTVDSNDPSDVAYGGIPSEYHQAILDFMLREGSRYDGSEPPMSPKDYALRYEDSKKNVRKHVRRRSGRRLAPMAVGYPGQSPTRRNDAYPRY